MADALTESQRTYLEGLRKGNPETSGMVVKFPPKREIQDEVTTQGYSPQIPSTALTQQLLDDFTNFQRFLIDNGCPKPQDRDLYLVVNRMDVLDLLHYIASRDCLILQNCFGFDRSISQGGQMQLVHKGNLWERQGITDADLFNSVYKKVGPDGKESFELFSNMYRRNHLSVETGRLYLKNFRDYYPNPTPGVQSFTLGYLLPVQALIAQFEDTSSDLGTTDEITFRWGLTSYSAATMDNFTLVIGTGDLSTGSIIVFRSGGIDGAGNEYIGRVPCPPNPGCQL